MEFFLGKEIKQHNQGIFICQQKYALVILKRFQVIGQYPLPWIEKNNYSKMVIQRRLCHSRSLNECLMYLITTRLDILHGASVLTKYLPCANEEHFKATKREFQIISKKLPIMESSMNDWKKLTFMDFLIVAGQVQLKIEKYI